MMLGKLKSSKNYGNIRGAQLQRRISEYVARQATAYKPDNNRAMKSRIKELEDEVEQLRATVKFYQDIYLLNE